MMKKMIVVFMLGVTLLFPPGILAQSQAGDLTKLSLEDLMNMEVYSASKKSERAFTTAAAISVITPEDIRRSGATSIPEVLRMVPGINVQRVNAHSWDISARGFNGSVFSNKLLVLIDGRAVYTPLYGGVFWDVQDVVLEDIERIEVVRGPGGTLWGANAVNGVINVITKKAQDTQGGLVSVGGGNEERAFSTVRYGSRTNKNDGSDWYYRTYAKYFNRDEGYRPTGTANDEWQMNRVGFRADNSNLTFQGDFYQGWLGQRVVYSDYNYPYAQIIDRTATVQGGNLLAKYQGEDWSLQSYWDVTDRDTQTLREKRDTFDVEFTKQNELTENQEITWGASYRLNLEDVKETVGLTILETAEADQLFSIFAQDEIKMMEDKLRFIFGSKLEYNIYTQMEVQPNARVSYALTDKNIVWAAASQAVRTPSRLETDAEITSTASLTPTYNRTLGNHDLSSETLRSLELGYRTQPSDKLLVNLALFADHYDDIISFVRGSTIIDRGFSVTTLPTANVMEGDIHGAELWSDFQFKDWWKIKASYTFAKSSLGSFPGINDLGIEKFLETSFPRHNAYVRSSFDLPKEMELDVTLRYKDSYLSGGVPSNTNMDINIGKKIQDWQISLVGQNLFRSHHRESSGSGIGLTQVERSGYLKITRKF